MSHACVGTLAGVTDARASSVETASDRRGAEPHSDRIVGVPFVRTHGAGEVGPVSYTVLGDRRFQLSRSHFLTSVCDAPPHPRRSKCVAYVDELIGIEESSLAPGSVGSPGVAEVRSDTSNTTPVKLPATASAMRKGRLVLKAP